MQRSETGNSERCRAFGACNRTKLQVSVYSLETGIIVLLVLYWWAAKRGAMLAQSGKRIRVVREMMTTPKVV